MKPEAEKRIKSRLVLDAIVKAENITVSDDEYEAELTKMSEEYKMPLDQIKEFTGEKEKKQIIDDMAVQKAVELIVSEAVEK
jgi:trigger factor